MPYVPRGKTKDKACASYLCISFFFNYLFMLAYFGHLNSLRVAMEHLDQPVHKIVLLS